MSPNSSLCTSERQETGSHISYPQGPVESFISYATERKGLFIQKLIEKQEIQFVCNRLHLIHLSTQDLLISKWCSFCYQNENNKALSSFNLLCIDDNKDIRVNCSNEHRFTIALTDLKDFKDCLECQKRLETRSFYESSVEQAKTNFLSVYKDLVRSCSLVKKIPIKSLVKIYFEKGIKELPYNQRASSMSTFIVLEHRIFVKNIFDRLNTNLKRKFFQKLMRFLVNAKSDLSKTKEALQFLKSLIK